MVRDALQRGLLTPGTAVTLLRDAAARRLVSLDMLARLGLGDAPTHEAPPQSPTPAGRAAGSSANLSNAETRLRSDAIPSAGSYPEHPDRSGAGIQWADRGSAPPLESPMGTGRVLGGRYVLERELGEGGMGIVYLAHDQEIQGETFAIKVLKPEIREHPEALALMREEVRKTRALQHPNIVGVYSLNGDGTDVYILMEYLEGKTLKALIDDDFGRGVPFDRAWPLIQDICRSEE